MEYGHTDVNALKPNAMFARIRVIEVSMKKPSDLLLLNAIVSY